MTSRIRQATLAFFLLLQLASAAFAQTVGRIEYANGTAKIERGGQVLAGIRGTELAEGDILTTAADTHLQLRMVDDAFIALRPNSRLSLEQYRNRAKEDDGVVLSLAYGIMRTFTGAIAARNRDRFVMRTPLATVGIRGSGNILAHLGDDGTVNHTITGEHSITATDASGKAITLITRPGETVQVRVGAPPRYIATPPFILAAASSSPAQVASSSPSSTRGDGTSSSASPGSSSPGGERSAPSEPVRGGTGGTSTLPGGVSSGGSTSISSTVQQAAAQANVRVPGGSSGPGPGPETALYASGSFPAAGTTGRTGFLAYDNDPGTAVITRDASGNLAGASNLSYRDELLGDAEQPSNYPTHALNRAALTLTGGTPQDYFRNVEQTIVLGRIEAPTVSATGTCDCGSQETHSGPVAPASVHYAMYEPTSLGIIHSLTGMTAFRLDGSTRPTDALGHVGTLNTATMNADFTSKLLDFTFNLSINNLTFSGSGTGISFDRSRFDNYSGYGTTHVTCAGQGCAQLGYGMNVEGAFAGSAASTAWLGYQIHNNRQDGQAYNEVIDGTMAFTAVTRPQFGIVLPLTGTSLYTLYDSYIGSGPGFPAFEVAASSQVRANFTARTVDFTMTMNRVLTPADTQAGFQPQSVTASAARLPIVGNLFLGLIGDPNRPTNMTVTCTGCGTAPPVGRFEGYFSYIAPDGGGDIGIYWNLTNNTQGTLGYDYSGTNGFIGPPPSLARSATVNPVSRPHLARLPEIIRGTPRAPR